LSSSYAVKIKNTQKVNIGLKSLEEIRLHAGQKTADGVDGCMGGWTATMRFAAEEKALG
jgi:hypothetical protein